jgi:hypothetical protein
LSLKRGAKHTFKNTGMVTATIVELFGKTPSAAANEAVTPLDDAIAVKWFLGLIQ